MSKVLLGAIITVVAVAAVGGIIVANRQDQSPATSATQTETTTSTNSENTSENTSTGTESKVPNQDIQSGAVTMGIKDYSYTKTPLKIKKGTKVVWTNQDSVRHDVTPDSESEAFKGSELLAKGKSYEFTFNSTGIYSYHCSPHPHMKATIEVVE